MGIQWEFNGNSMGVQWEFNGNSMGVQWDFNESSMGIQWDFNKISMRVQWGFNGRSNFNIFLQQPSSDAKFCVFTHVVSVPCRTRERRDFNGISMGYQ